MDSGFQGGVDGLGVSPQEVPGQPYVDFGCMEVPYGQPDYELVVEPGMGNEDLTCFVDRLEQSFVGQVDCEIVLRSARLPAKADDAEGYGSE